MPELSQLDLAELLSPTLTTELGRSLTRARVQQYQRYFADADRVLILLHNEPDPDALAAGLALRNVLRRTRTTAIIGALQGHHAARRTSGWPTCSTSRSRPSRPMSSPASTALRPWTSSRTISEGLLPRVDLVVDHHPEQPGYTAVFKDIRADYGSTCTILTEHLRAVDVNISERTATAMLYAIKSDTLFFARQTNRLDLEAFSFLYPLADPALIRKMEGAEITLERLEHVTRALATSRLRESGLLGVPRRDLARGLHPVHRRLPAAGRGRQVDDGLGHRRRPAHPERPEPWLQPQRRRVREGELRRHRQRGRPSGDGQGRDAGRTVPWKFGDLSGIGIAARIGDLAEEFLQRTDPRAQGAGQGRGLNTRSSTRSPAAATGSMKCR